MPDPLDLDLTALGALLRNPEVETISLAVGAAPALVGVKRAGRATAWASGPGGTLAAALRRAVELLAPPAPPQEPEP